LAVEMGRKKTKMKGRGRPEKTAKNLRGEKNNGRAHKPVTFKHESGAWGRKRDSKEKGRIQTGPERTQGLFVKLEGLEGTKTGVFASQRDAKRRDRLKRLSKAWEGEELNIFRLLYDLIQRLLQNKKKGVVLPRTCGQKRKGKESGRISMISQEVQRKRSRRGSATVGLFQLLERGREIKRKPKTKPKTNARGNGWGPRYRMKKKFHMNAGRCWTREKST